MSARCVHCHNGKLPERIQVMLMRIFGIPGRQVILRCPWCNNPLSVGSLQHLDKQIVEPERYRNNTISKRKVK